MTTPKKPTNKEKLELIENNIDLMAKGMSKLATIVETIIFKMKQLEGSQVNVVIDSDLDNKKDVATDTDVDSKQK